MPETFSPSTWADGSGGGTPITAAQLNRIENGIESMDDRVTALEAAPAGYLTVQDEGSTQTQRATLNFVGAGVTAVDDSANARTTVTIPGGGGGGGGTTNILSALDYGATGNGTSDDTAALQSWLNAIPDGGKAYLPRGRYRITSGLTLPDAAHACQIEGAGNTGQSALLGYGGSVIVVDGAGVVGLSVGTYGSAHFQGVMIRNLVFRDPNGTAAGGLILKRQNNFVLENVGAFDFNATGAYGIYNDGSDGTGGSQSGNTAQYGNIINPSLNNCAIGLKLYRSNGLRVFGGMMDGNNNNGTVPTNRTAISILDGDTNYFYGVVIQFYTTAVDITNHENCEFHGVRVEGCTNGYKINASAYGTHIFGGTINNSIIGGTGTGITIASGSQRNGIYAPYLTALTTNISDAGTNTQFFNENIFKLGDGSGGYIKAPVYADSGSRPAANAVPAGAQAYQTNIGKPIWSNGTNWRDAAGTTV